MPDGKVDCRRCRRCACPGSSEDVVCQTIGESLVALCRSAKACGSFFCPNHLKKEIMALQYL